MIHTLVLGVSGSFSQSDKTRISVAYMQNRYNKGGRQEKDERVNELNECMTLSKHAMRCALSKHCDAMRPMAA